MGKPIRGLKPPSILSSDILGKPDDAPNADSQTPIFSFRHVKKEYCGCQPKGNDHIKVWDRIERTSTLTWNEIKKSDRFTNGAEPIKHVKKPLPSNVPAEVKLLAFHTNASLARIIGYRSARIFNILWVDCVGDIYDH